MIANVDAVLWCKPSMASTGPKIMTYANGAGTRREIEMRAGSPFDALHGALASATKEDLPDISYWARDWSVYKNLSKEEKGKLGPSDGPGEWKKRRPEDYEVEIIMFPQTWGSTALGYGGMGGAAMTTAYTVIVSDASTSCVYFGGGRLAYLVDHKAQFPEGRDRFWKDVQEHNMAHCGENRYA